MGLWNRYALPRLIEFSMRQPPIMRQRGKVVPEASGRVLEIGVGSGLNLAFYDRARVEHVSGVEPSRELGLLACARARAAGLAFELIEAGAEDIPLDDASVDSVVMTYTLCTLPHVPESLAEMRRVLRPGGALHFVEHGAAPDPGVARWQRRVEPLWKRLAGGCHLTRNAPELLAGAGFAVERLESMYLPGPRIATWTTWGHARRQP